MRYRVERECNKDITYGNISIKKGTLVSVPAFALHYDEDYYPDPHTFNPDRFRLLILFQSPILKALKGTRVLYTNLKVGP